MKLEKIITLGNAPVRLRLLAMERSLRATGCDLPLLVIPYDERRFELPPNASWWTTGIRTWAQEQKAHPLMFKHQCLNEANYQYVDSDVIFLKDPAKVLADHTGFITSCGHWHDSQHHVITDESLPILQEKTTCWQRNVFNSGQFACDRALYTEEELKRTCLDPRIEKTCLRLAYDQPALVLLANMSGVPIHNLTLPPISMESTWAGDYVQSYENYWTDETRKPYLLHWAGCTMWEPRSVDPLFLEYLTKAELVEWEAEIATKKAADEQYRASLRTKLRGVAKGMKVIAKEVSK